jgi:hypothetical protein
MGAIECDGSLVCIVRSSRLARSLARHSTGSKGMRMVRSAREGVMIIRSAKRIPSDHCFFPIKLSPPTCTELQ